MFIFSALATSFFILTMGLGLFTISTQKLTRKDIIKALFTHLYIGISMGLFFYFIPLKPFVAVLIFLHLFLVCIIMAAKMSLIKCDLIITIIIGIILCIFYLLDFKYKYSNILWIILGIGLYLLPALSYFDRKNYLVQKIKRCTKEVQAKIVKVTRTTRSSSSSKIYVPTIEFTLDGKLIKFMNPNEIYSINKFTVGDTITILINPDNPKFNGPNGNCDDIFSPNTYVDDNYRHNFAVILWYATTLIIFLFLGYLILFG